MSRSILCAAVAAIVLVVQPAFGDDKHGHGAAAQASQDGTMTNGVIRKVNRDAGKLTIKHEEIKNLDMPAMTMVFQVSDRTMLERVKEGDRVRFAAESKGGAVTVIKIEPAQ